MSDLKFLYDAIEWRTVTGGLAFMYRKTIDSCADEILAVLRAAWTIDDEDRAEGLPMRPRERVLHEALASLAAKSGQGGTK